MNAGCSCCLDCWVDCPCHVNDDTDCPGCDCAPDIDDGERGGGFENLEDLEDLVDEE